jgi:hypothetical protein
MGVHNLDVQKCPFVTQLVGLCEANGGRSNGQQEAVYSSGMVVRSVPWCCDEQREFQHVNIIIMIHSTRYVQRNAQSRLIWELGMRTS